MVTLPGVPVAYASWPGSAGVNEDRVVIGSNWAVVLDGATAPVGVDSGCRHDVRWLVERLGAALGDRLARPEPVPLREVLAAAIEETCAAHAGSCDLRNPDSPSSTVAMVRRSGGGYDYLVLADSVALFPGSGEAVRAICDDRPDHLPGGRPYSHELVRRHRNSPGGFWVASTDPLAAEHALTGRVDAEEPNFGLLSDGCSRLVDFYGHTWDEVWRVLAKTGPESVISWVREEELRHGAPRGKPHDDATAVYGTFPLPPPVP